MAEQETTTVAGVILAFNEIAVGMAIGQVLFDAWKYPVVNSFCRLPREATTAAVLACFVRSSRFSSLATSFSCAQAVLATSSHEKVTARKGKRKRKPKVFNRVTSPDLRTST